MAESVEPLQKGHYIIVLAADNQSQEGYFPREELPWKHLDILLGVQQFAEIGSGTHLMSELAQFQQHSRIQRTGSIPKRTVVPSLESLSQGLLVGSHQSHALLHSFFIDGIGEDGGYCGLHDCVGHEDHVEYAT